MKPPSPRHLLWLVLPMLLLALAVWFWRPREPEWEGKPLSFWLERLAVPWGDSIYDEPATPGEQAAYRAIRGMGTNALPALLRRMSQPVPRPWERNVMQVEDYLDARGVRYPWRRVNEQAFLNEAAVFRAFFALGTLADPAVPELRCRLYSTNETDAVGAAHVLARIGPHGVLAVFAASTNAAAASRAAAAFGLSVVVTNRAEALPVLLVLSHDPEPRVRASVAQALERYRDNATEVVGPLIVMLSDRDVSVRRVAAQTLSGFPLHADLSVAVPALTALKADPEKWVREMATNLLDAIADTSTATPTSKRPSP
jgi:hypothetical protein